MDGDAWIRWGLSRADANETDSFMFPPLCAEIVLTVTRS